MWETRRRVAQPAPCCAASRENMRWLGYLAHNLDPRTYATRLAATYLAIAVVFERAARPPPPPDAPVAWAGWCSVIVTRNVALMLAVYSLWYYALYVRRVSRAKLDPAWPRDDLLGAERLRSLVGACVASLAEVACIALAGRGSGAPSALSIAASTYASAIWSDYHFWAAHRILHPWFATSSPRRRLDLGRWLYRHVHSVHHRSVNPNPWSGLSMHWFEHALYFSRAPLFVALAAACGFRVPPLAYFFCNVRALLGPAPGHHVSRPRAACARASLRASRTTTAQNSTTSTTGTLSATTARGRLTAPTGSAERSARRDRHTQA